VNLHLIREEPSLSEKHPQPRFSRMRQVLWSLLGVTILLLGGDVFSALNAAHHSYLGSLATIIVWLQAFQCFVHAHRSVR
jgi:hypothetical protein